MKKEIAKLWVDALRSGKYNQGTRHLESGDRFCCLCVLCKLGEDNGQALYKCNKEITGRNLYDQPNIKGWSGLRSGYGSVYSSTNSLVHLNDSGKSFNEIADIIEQYWEEL